MVGTIQMTRKTLSMFDMDETLFRTAAQVRVCNANSGLVCVLDNQSFNGYKLKPGERYDFSQFRDSEFFSQTSKPIESIIKELKEHYSHNKMYGGMTVIITARGDFTDKEIFLSFLESHGLPVRDTKFFYIHRTGDGDMSIPVAEKKKIVIEEYLKVGYDVVTFFDDNLNNLIEFMKLSETWTRTEFCSFLVRRHD